MFSLDIVDSDQFTDLPPMARLLYYELGVRADDDGFVGNPRKITRFAECSEDDIKTLDFYYLLRNLCCVNDDLKIERDSVFYNQLL